ncbi:MAG: VWA domain-containing protein [Pyrinomonadaceae bacterium]|nr:VWA domain-containing protein [Pyrinomonadaceae bacterium]
MRRVFYILILVFCFSALSFAQSGRKVEQKSTTVSPGEKPIFSETSIYKRRRLYKPIDQGKLKKKKKKRKSRKSKKKKADITPVILGEEEADDIIKIESTLVTIPVSVYSRQGLYIPNLRKEDFKIFEDGVEHDIAYFGTTDKPFTVVLLIDTSPSTAYSIGQIREAAKVFVDELKPQDRVMVISFDRSVDVLTNPTNSRKKIYKAIDKADFGGGTSLYDAVEYALEKKLNKIRGRKAIVLFTDGVDTTSRGADYLENIAEVEESDVTIYPVYYNTYRQMVRQDISRNPMGSRGGYGNVVGIRAKDYALGRQYLLELSGSTGGRIFLPTKTADGLRNAFRGIAEELRHQYNIGYYPEKIGKPGDVRQIKVRVYKPKMVVRNRTSYTVGRNKEVLGKN